MKHKSAAAAAIVLLALAGALAGMLLRSYLLTRCLDAQGLLIPGNPIMLITAAVLAVFVGALALLCTRLNRLPGTQSCFSGAVGFLLASAAGGALVLFGSALRLTQGVQLAERLIFLGGIVAGALLVIAALLQFNGKRIGFGFYGIACLFFVARLIFDFKNWSADPVVADFCFLLLTGVCAMLALLNLGGFCFSLGKRRATIFWCIACALFALLLVPDYLLSSGNVDTARLLVSGGIALWCLSYALQLLRPSVQNEQPPAEALPEENTAPVAEDAAQIAQNDAE